MIEQSAADAMGGAAADQSSSVSGGSLGAGSYAPEGHPDNTASVTATVPPLTLVPQVPTNGILKVMDPFLPSPIPQIVATLTQSDDAIGGTPLYAGSYRPTGGGGGLVNTATDDAPATATSSGGFPTVGGVTVDIAGGGNMQLPSIPGSAPGSTTVPQPTTEGTVLGTPFTARQLLIAAAVLFLLR